MWSNNGRMRGICTYLAKADGNVAVLFALMAFVLLGAGGVALDFTRWQAQRSQLQEAGDAGALAGATELGIGGHGKNARAEERARALVLANLGSAAAAVDVDVTVDDAAKTVTVELNVVAEQLLSQFIVKAPPNLGVKSLARVAGAGVVCIHALEESDSKSMQVSGSAQVDADGCIIQINSSSNSALTSSAEVSAQHICVVGDYSGSGYAPTPETGCAPIADPFADLVVPTAGACDYNSVSITSNATLYPGVYCGGLSVTGNAAASLMPGEYHIRDGALKLASGGSVSGDHVVFILSGTATLAISGSGEFATTPPVSGALAGFSFVQDPSAPAGETSKITGEGRFVFPGVVYLPRQSLDISGRASGNGHVPTYTAVVTQTLKIVGQGELNVIGDTDDLPKGVARRITHVNARLIE